MPSKSNAAPELELPKRQGQEGLVGAHSLCVSYHGPAQKSISDNYFTEIRERVPAIDAAHHYGLQFDRSAKKARCPFHDDRHPSLSFYKGGFKCFACGASGSSIDLVMQLLCLDLKGAAARLNEDFHLGLDREPTAAERDAARKVQEARKLFSDWKEKTMNEIDAAVRAANLADPADMTDAEALAIRHRETFLYWSDILQHGDLEEQMQIFREREEVHRLCQMTSHNTPTKSKTA